MNLPTTSSLSVPVSADSDSNDWYSPKGAAADMKVGVRSVYRAIRRGKLRAAKVNGRDFRIHRTWLLDWLNQSAEAVQR